VRPEVKVEIAFATRPTEAPTWVDVSQYVRAVDTSRGRNMELDRVEAGTATVLLDNRDRRFDPTNVAGPYYGYLLPMRRIRFAATWLGVRYPILAGFVERWPLRYEDSDAWVAVPCVDGFKVLNMGRLSTNYPEQKSGERVAAVLQDAQWTMGYNWIVESPINGILGETTYVGPNMEWLIQTGLTTVQAVTLDKATPLSHMQDVTETENGTLFVDRGGNLVFWDRHQPLTAPQSESQALFGDADGELSYTDIELSYDDGLIYNEVSLTREGGTAQVVEDVDSRLKYFRRTYDKSGLLMTADEIARSAALYKLAQYREPGVRASRLIFEGPLPDDVWTALLAREIGDRVTVRRRPPGGGAMIE